MVRTFFSLAVALACLVTAFSVQAQEPSCGCETAATACDSCCSSAHGFCLHKKLHGCKLFSKCHAKPCCETESCCDDACGGSKGCGKLCGHHGCCRNKKYIEGIERNFNCGCNGSYNYPVPPQYTYHWPGMFKQKLMTDYHSAWRFPAIKPYIDEEAFDAYSETYSINENNIETVSAHTPIISVRRTGQVESMSSKFENIAQ
jgi:hypothetical protein